MNYLLFVAIVFSVPYFTSTIFADCNINEDWADAPCLDTIVNGRYEQHEVDKWAEYYSYKGSIFMEQKYAEMNNAIDENLLQDWADESIQNRNVYEYYFFSGRAPNTGESRDQFDVIDVSEENAPAYGKLAYPNIVPAEYKYVVPAIVVSAVVVGIVFVTRRKIK